MPTVFVGPLAGVYLDRYNKRDVFLTSLVIQGIIVAVVSELYIQRLLSIELLLIGVLMLNVAAQFFRPTTMIPLVVRKTELVAANSLFGMSSSMNQLAAYGLGGIVVATLGAEIPILYNGLTFFVAAALVALVSGMYGISQTSHQKPTSFRARFGDGIHYIRNKRLLIELIALAVMVNFLSLRFRISYCSTR